MKALLIVRANATAYKSLPSDDPMSRFYAPLLRVLAGRWAEYGRPLYLDLFVIDNDFTDEEFMDSFDAVDEKLSQGYTHALFVLRNTDTKYLRQMASLNRPTLSWQRVRGSTPTKIGKTLTWLDQLDALHKLCLEKV